jgi:type I restriction enzyme, S subunit
MPADSRAVVRLGDHVELQTGFPFKSSDFTTNPRSVRLLRGDNVAQGTLRWDDAKRWPEGQTNGLADYRVRVGDVILAMDRPWIEAGLKFAAVAPTDVPALLVQRVARLRAKPTMDQRFLKYVVASQSFTDFLVGIQTGTAVPHISGPQIESYEFGLPELNEQRAIARVLGSLDDKMELNRRMNSTLEQIAHAMFKSWFVDFYPVRAKAAGRWKQGESLPGMPAEMWDLWPKEFEESESGEIPKGWEIGPMESLAEVAQGSTPSTSAPEYWESPEIDWVTVRDLSAAAHSVLLTTERKLSRLGVAKVGSEVVPTGTILLSTGAPIGYSALSAIPVALGTRVAAIKPRNGTGTQYLLQWAASNTGALRDAANGTTFPQLLLSTLRAFPLVVPPRELLSKFDEVLSPIQNRLVASGRESSTLARTRDALLPKLLSGEIRVPLGGSH